MTNTPTDIERIVMRRARTAYYLRPLANGTALALFILLLALYGIGREVWVAKVFENGPQDVLGHAQYLAYAFGHTRAPVQALSVAAFFSMLWFFRDLLRATRGVLAPREA